MSKIIDMNINKICTEVEVPEKTVHANHKANATVILKNDSDREIRISGFTIWESNLDGKLNLQVPRRGKGFKFWFSDMQTLEEVSNMVIAQYEETQGSETTEKPEDFSLDDSEIPF